MSVQTQPLVNVVTPVYNGEAYLSECIESVLAQTYQNWDCTIINNCSTDRSLEIALGYKEKDPRIHIHNNSEFVGMLKNHNIALRQISPESKYCKIVFADDLLFPECLTEMVKIAEEHPSVNIVGAYGLMGTRVVWDGLPYPSTVVSGRQICRDTLLGGPYVFGNPTSVLMRSEIIRSRDPFYDESNIHTDTAVCYEILQDSDFGFVHKVLTYSRIREGSGRTFSQRFNTYLPGLLHDLIKYGPIYLKPEELEAGIKVHLKTYYEFLGRSVFYSYEKSFWQYHETKLKDLGYPLSKLKLASAMFLLGIDHLLNPKRAIEGRLSRWFKNN